MLTGNLFGFDLQAAVKLPSFTSFQQVFPFATVPLFTKCVELPQRKQHLLERKSYLFATS